MLKDLEKPIEYLKGVGEKRAECYEKLGVKTVYDLLCHYPRSYIDYTSPVPIADAPTNEPCIVKGRVVKKLPEARIRKGLSVYKVIFTDDVTDLVIVIYNSEYMYIQAGLYLPYRQKVSQENLSLFAQGFLLSCRRGNTLYPLQAVYTYTRCYR